MVGILSDFKLIGKLFYIKVLGSGFGVPCFAFQATQGRQGSAPPLAKKRPV
jgi:hypothetical protein